jgi:hypothetical protein
MSQIKEIEITPKTWGIMASMMADSLQTAASNADLDYSHFPIGVLSDAIVFLESACAMNATEFFGFRASDARSARANYGLAYRAFLGNSASRGYELATLRCPLVPGVELVLLTDFIRRLSSRDSGFFQGKDFRSALLWAGGFFRALADLATKE